MTNNQKINLSKLSIGQRIKYVRHGLLRVTRQEFSKKYGVSQDTLASWETGARNITEESLEKIINIFRAEGLLISKEWILGGQGIDPKFFQEATRYFKVTDINSELGLLDDEILILKELEFFLSESKNNVSVVLTTDEMLPYYSIGDYLAGRLRYKKDILECIGRDCIIKMKDGTKFVKRLSKHPRDKEDEYTLIALNPCSSGSLQPVMYRMKIEAAAPIIWIRRSNKLT